MKLFGSKTAIANKSNDNVIITKIFSFDIVSSPAFTSATLHHFTAKEDIRKRKIEKIFKLNGYN